MASRLLLFTIKTLLLGCFFVSSSLYGQLFEELPLTVSDSSSHDIANYILGTVPSNTLSDEFDYSPINPTANLPQQSFTTADAMHFWATSNAWVAYSLESSDILGETSTYAIDIWGRNGNVDRDNDFSIDFYSDPSADPDVDAPYFSVSPSGGIPDEEPYFLRTLVSADDVDPTVSLAFFVIRNTNTSQRFFTYMEVRMAKRFELIQEDTLHLCAGASIEIPTDTNGQAYNWYSTSTGNGLSLNNVTNDTLSFRNTQVDTTTVFLLANYDGAEIVDSIILVTHEGAKIDSLISGTCTGGNAAEVVLHANENNPFYNWSSTDLGSLSEGDSIYTLTLTQSQYVRLSSDDPDFVGTCADSIYLSFDASEVVVGDPTAYGDGQWNAYFYDQADFTDYLGVYTFTNDSIKTTDDWAVDTLPSAASTYTGCTPSSLDNFAVDFKRKGFNCSFYQLQIASLETDDQVEVLMNGNSLVSLNSSDVFPWQLDTVLGPETTLDIRFVGGTGDEYLDMSITPIDPTSSLITSTYEDSAYVCTESSIPIEALEDNFTAFYWSSTAGTIETGSNSVSFEAPSTEEDITIVLGLGCTESSNILLDTLTLVSTQGLLILDANVDSICDDVVDADDQMEFFIGIDVPLTWSFSEGIVPGASSTITDSSIIISQPATDLSQYIKVSTDGSMFLGNTCALTDSVYYNADALTLGDPNIFGDNQWHEYYYDTTRLIQEDYLGYARFGEAEDASFDTREYWGYSNPSAATASNHYFGCREGTIVNSFTTIYKRKGFVCNRYQINTFSDDSDELYIDGEFVSSNAVNTTYENAYTGIFNENTEVAFHMVNIGGGAAASLTFEEVDIVGDEEAKLFDEPANDVFYICTGGSTYDFALRGDNFTFNTTDHLTFNATNDTAHYTSPADADTVVYVVTSQSCDDSPFTLTDSLTVISSDSSLTEILEVEGDSSCVSGGTSTGSVNLVASGANSYTWSADPTGSLETTEGDIVQATPTSLTKYTVVGTIVGSTCAAGITVDEENTTQDTVSVGVYDLSQGAPGDTSEFGDNAWLGYFFDKPDFTNYYGYTNSSSPSVTNSFGLNTGNDFFLDFNPSANLNDQYFGCTSGDDDDFSIIYKRKGFTCGFYTITLRDDDFNDNATQIFIDGVDVTPLIDDFSVEVGTFYLDANSEITLKGVEMTNRFRIALNLDEQSIGNTVLAQFIEDASLAIWVGETDGNWNDASNWCLDRQPSQTVDAYIIPPTVVGGIDFPSHYPQVDQANTETRSLLNFGELSLEDGGQLSVYRDVENGGEIFLNNGTVLMTGSLEGEVLGDSGVHLSHLTIDKSNTSNTVEFSTNVSISEELVLNNGILTSTTGDTLTILDDAIISNASAERYVEAVISKIGDDDFEFPIGKDGIYAPASISSATDAVTDTVTLEYFYDNPSLLSGAHAQLQDTINRLSIYEYWNIDFGTNVDTNYALTLTWDNDQRESGINSTSYLDVGFYDQDSSKWVLQESTVSGTATYTAGSLTTNTSHAITKAGQLSFVTSDLSGVLNPLPVDFDRFSAELINDIPHLSWITSSETNNDYFIIERSSNAVDFDSLGYEDGAGTSSQRTFYTYMDQSYTKGMTYYYRIRQVDYDGTITTSKVVSVSTNGRSETNEGDQLKVYPSPIHTGESLNISYGGSIYGIQMKNYMGHELFSKEVSTQRIEIDNLDFLPHGIYFLHIDTSEGVKVVKVVKTK